jgi:hypothetical protein
VAAAAAAAAAGGEGEGEGEVGAVGEPLAVAQGEEVEPPPPAPPPEGEGWGLSVALGVEVVEVEGEWERRGQAEEDALRATDREGSALRDTRKEAEWQPEIEGEPLEDAVPALEAEGEPVVEGEAHTVTLAVGEASPDAVRAGLAVPQLVGSALLVIDTEPHGELLGVGEGRIVDDKVFAGDTLRSGVRDGHSL